MAYSPIEDKFLSALTTAQFPEEPVAEMQQPQNMAQPDEGVQVAEVGATKMPDYGYSGQRQATMTDYDPTVRERMADFLQAGFERFGMDRYKARKQAQTLIGGPSSNLPLNIGLADIVPFLGTALQTQEAARMGEESITSVQQGNYGTAALQAGGAVLGMVPGVAGTVKAAKALPKNIPVGASVKPVGEIPTGAPTAPTSDIGFYSAVEQAALRIQRKQGTGQAMLNDILKGENVKQDEVKWIGLDDFLKGKKSVTREEVQQYIAENKVDIQEVTLADVKAAPVSTENITDYFEETLTPNGDEARGIFNLSFTENGASEPTSFTAYEMKGGAVELYDNRGNFIDEYRTLTDARNHVINESEFSATQSEGRTRYGGYTLPGGENYREILLTMPTQFERMSKPLESEIRALGLNQNLSDISRRDLMDAGASEDLQNRFTQAMRGSPEGSYHSSHWDQPNVLAHIRVNDRVDADGKKMLLVEEVQSDWHQEGRNKGYRTKESLEDWYNKNKLENDPPFAQLDSQQVSTIERNRNAGMGGDTAVPDAPMKDTWYQLALKRVLKYAADNGYERVGLTTGSRQAERYDLSKQINALTYNLEKKKLVAFDSSWDRVLERDDVSPEQVADFVGKDVAKKLMESPKEDVTGNHLLKGQDLSVGGEGMKKYYDEIYPQFLAKYGKKWDAKVGETTVKADGAEPVRYIDITPQMRESVSKGQPLFTATGLGTGTGAATMQDKEKK